MAPSQEINDEVTVYNYIRVFKKSTVINYIDIFKAAEDFLRHFIIFVFYHVVLPMMSYLLVFELIKKRLSLLEIKHSMIIGKKLYPIQKRIFYTF